MRRHKLLGAPVRRAECASRKFFTATRRAVFFFAAQTVDAPSKSGLNYDRSVSEIVQYMFNYCLGHQESCLLSGVNRLSGS